MTILKCGACGTEGSQEDFENANGELECKWCESDVWLDTKENHEDSN